MLLRHLSLLALCAPADDTPAPVIAGAPAPAVPESPGLPVSQSPPLPVSEPSAPKPGVIAQATALLRGANGNAATIAALRGDLTALDATITQLQADVAARDATIAAQLTELQAFRAQAADLQNVVQTLESQRTDVQTEVIHQLAAAGLPEGQLPRGTTSAAPTATAEELWQQAEAASDPKEKGRLAAQALKLTEGKVHSLN